ncbi:MAG: DUF5368 domain-containing protein [Azospira sp.]|jgi:hypothetical protein|nr:DUF5368 domain-containing protein [Azospira sp.]
MQELDPLVLLAVFQEMLGPQLWLLILLAVAGIIGFAALLLRERRLYSRRLVVSELFGLVGGVLALVLMAQFSVSGFSDAGGPIDWLLIGLVYGVGLVGSTILVYAALGWMGLLRTGGTTR